MIFVLVILFIILLVVLVAFVIQNVALVSLTFFGFGVTHVSLGLVVLVAFLVGVLLTYLIGTFGTLRHKIIIAGKNRNVKSRERTIDELRAQVVKLETELRMTREQKTLPPPPPVR